MDFDNHVNLLSATVKVAPVPATTGQTLTLMPGDAGRFLPDMPVTLCPRDREPTFDNSEIAYVADVDGDALTVSRAQEGTIAKEVKAGWRVIGSPTAKTFQDLESALLDHRAELDGKASKENCGVIQRMTCKSLNIINGKSVMVARARLPKSTTGFYTEVLMTNAGSGSNSVRYTFETKWNENATGDFLGIVHLLDQPGSIIHQSIEVGVKGYVEASHNYATVELLLRFKGGTGFTSTNVDIEAQSRAETSTEIFDTTFEDAAITDFHAATEYWGERSIVIDSISASIPFFYLPSTIIQCDFDNSISANSTLLSKTFRGLYSIQNDISKVTGLPHSSTGSPYSPYWWILEVRPIVRTPGTGAGGTYVPTMQGAFDLFRMIAPDGYYERWFGYFSTNSPSTAVRIQSRDPQLVTTRSSNDMDTSGTYLTSVSSGTFAVVKQTASHPAFDVNSNGQISFHQNGVYRVVVNASFKWNNGSYAARRGALVWKLSNTARQAISHEGPYASCFDCLVFGGSASNPVFSYDNTSTHIIAVSDIGGANGDLVVELCPYVESLAATNQPKFGAQITVEKMID